MKPNIIQRGELALVVGYTYILNFLLRILERVCFRKIKDPQNILVFKGGNIGDIVCAVPSFIAIRRAYPGARITLLTSPGARGVPGAKELLQGAWYFDAIDVYDSQDIDSLGKIFRFASRLREKHYDVFAHIPVHDWISFSTLVRNIFFAKLIGVKYAFGFRVRTIMGLFRKTQINFTLGEKEVASLLDMLREYGITSERPEFDLPIPEDAEEAVAHALLGKWPTLSGGAESMKHLLIAIHPGSKLTKKRWPPERFGAVAQYLEKKYKAQFIIVGGEDDVSDARIISSFLNRKNVLITAGVSNVFETVAFLKRCDFLLGVDSGPMHIAAAFGRPTVALFSVITILGKWFPYGENHEAVFHRFLNCDYRSAACVKRGMELITVEEVERACDRVIERLR